MLLSISLFSIGFKYAQPSAWTTHNFFYHLPKLIRKNYLYLRTTVNSGILPVNDSKYILSGAT